MKIQNNLNASNVDTGEAVALITEHLNEMSTGPAVEESYVCVVNLNVDGSINVLAAKRSSEDDIDGSWTLSSEDFTPPDFANGVYWGGDHFSRIAGSLDRVIERTLVDLNASLTIDDDGEVEDEE